MLTEFMIVTVALHAVRLLQGLCTALSIATAQPKGKSHGGNVISCVTDVVELLRRQHVAEKPSKHVCGCEKRRAVGIVEHHESLFNAPGAAHAQSRSKRSGHSALCDSGHFPPAYADGLAGSVQRPGCFGMQHARDARQRQHCRGHQLVAVLSRTQTSLSFSALRIGFAQTRALFSRGHRTWAVCRRSERS